MLLPLLLLLLLLFGWDKANKSIRAVHGLIALRNTECR
jgi:hypothetical protein